MKSTYYSCIHLPCIFHYFNKLNFFLICCFLKNGAQVFQGNTVYTSFNTKQEYTCIWHILRTAYLDYRCQLCICETHLKSYESLVFAVSKKQTEHSMVGNVLLLGQLNQGTWKPCEMERVLRGKFVCTGV